MPTFRSQKPKGYTVISNYIFKDEGLSLKSIGLFCYMLSRPEDWHFSIKGLEKALSKDGKQSISTAMTELKAKNYIRVDPNQKDELGRMVGSAYYLYQIPYDVDRTKLKPSIFTGDKQGRGDIKIERFTDFCCLSNYHLLDDLSLKAMGLLSFLLNLPDEYNNFGNEYFQKKFSDGRTAIASAINELQEKGYLVVNQPRNEKGVLGKVEYYIFEVPDYTFSLDKEEVSERLPQPENLQADNPLTENRVTENRDAGNQVAEKQTQRNIITTNINKRIINSSSSDVQFEFSDIKSSTSDREMMKMKVKELIQYQTIIDRNLELDELLEEDKISLEEYDNSIFHEKILNSIVFAITDVYMADSDLVEIGQGSPIPKYRVIENFESLELRDIREIINRIREAKPKNKRGYILKVISNY